MEKISPLRAGLNAINNTFKANKADNNKQNSTNPFGISFKGTLLQMDVFETGAKKAAKNAAEKVEAAFSTDKFEKTAKAIKADDTAEVLKDTASKTAETAENAVKSNPFAEKLNGFMSSAKETGNNIKQNALAFCGKVKDTFAKIKNADVSLNLFGNSVSKLSKRPVNDLEGMFKTEVAKA